MMTDRRPHSRACGITPHAHGPACHINCPSCAGGPAGHDEATVQRVATAIREALRRGGPCVERRMARAALAAAGVREDPPTAAEEAPTVGEATQRIVVHLIADDEKRTACELPLAEAYLAVYLDTWTDPRPARRPCERCVAAVPFRLARGSDTAPGEGT